MGKKVVDAVGKAVGVVRIAVAAAVGKAAVEIVGKAAVEVLGKEVVEAAGKAVAEAVRRAEARNPKEKGGRCRCERKRGSSSRRRGFEKGSFLDERREL